MVASGDALNARHHLTFANGQEVLPHGSSSPGRRVNHTPTVADIADAGTPRHAGTPNATPLRRGRHRF
jgi:hypothetical protein